MAAMPSAVAPTYGGRERPRAIKEAANAGCEHRVVAMYSKYPYPSPVAGRTLAYDIANLFSLLREDDDLDGRKVLDAGCGTGPGCAGWT